MRRGEQHGLVVRQKSPLNLEFQFSTLDEWIIPTEQFYVRSHFPAPDLDAVNWRLKVDGAVENPLELTLDEVMALPSASLTAVMECAGNGRVFYEPVREGLQWQHGAVGNASWTGALLRDLLAKAGVRPEAQEVVLIGADRGVVDGGKKTASPGPIAFARSLSLQKALDDSSLLAYAMNGEPLTLEHGFPLRGVIGGWFGMAWVKWITHIRVVDRPFLGYWQARDYFRWERHMGEPILVPLTEMAVKAQIARPVNGAILSCNRPVRIFGAAWSGESEVEEVCLSVQQLGADIQEPQWLCTTLLAPETRYAWRFWEYHWTPTEPGRYRLQCRARDADGNLQPETQQADRESYMANWMVPVDVKVVEAASPANDYADEFVI